MHNICSIYDGFNKEIFNKIKKEAIQNKSSDRTNDFEIKAAHGTVLYCSIYYQKHQYNVFTSHDIPSRYVITLQRQKREIAAFSDLNDESGAAVAELRQVTRKSNKQLRLAIDDAVKTLSNILAKYPQL